MDGGRHDVVFVGTTRGRVIKFVSVRDGIDGAARPVVIEEMQVGWHGFFFFLQNDIICRKNILTTKCIPFLDFRVATPSPFFEEDALEKYFWWWFSMSQYYVEVSNKTCIFPSMIQTIIWVLSPPQVFPYHVPVTNLELVRPKQSNQAARLIVLSSHEVKSIPLSRCGAQQVKGFFWQFFWLFPKILVTKLIHFYTVIYLTIGTVYYSILQLCFLASFSSYYTVR